MAMIQFVNNYEDLSTDRGYQFKFYCDKCGNGHMSQFQASIVGTAGSVLRAASNFLGGWVSTAANSSYDIQRAVGGKAHDDALAAAVAEGKRYFHQCSRCGKWVCPDICWNAGANQCEECAPNFEEGMSAAHAHAKAEAARQQLYEKAQQTDYVSGIDMRAGSVLGAAAKKAAVKGQFCSECGTATGQAKFCPECGTPAAAAKKPSCASCGFEPGAPAKFCPECGGKMV